jgi:hypothetical protein
MLHGIIYHFFGKISRKFLKKAAVKAKLFHSPAGRWKNPQLPGARRAKNQRFRHPIL